MRLRPLLAGLGVLLAGAHASGAEPATVERTIDVGGVTRSYLIHVPRTWDGVRPLPVLFVFHGAGSDAESMVRATGFDALADASPATPLLVVYPRAPAASKRYEVDPPRGRPSADVLFVDALLERLRARFPVDARRIAATGFSNGAALCYRLAAERPRVLAAIAPVAGYLPDLSGVDPSVPVPLLHVHGTADGRVGAPGAGAGSASAVRTWAQRNAAGRGPVETRLPDPGGLVLRHLAYAGPSPRSDTQLLLAEGQGHVWPGGPGGTVSRTILAFLAAHPQDATPDLAGPAGPLVGRPFGSLEALRWPRSDGAPFSLAARPLTLFRWWTNACAHCRVSVPVLAGLEQRYRARGLRLVAVYHPKSVPLTDAAAQSALEQLGFAGPLAFDDRWTKYTELSARGALRSATSISVLVDADGLVRWVHPGPRIEPGSADLRTLDALLDRLLPPSPGVGMPPPR